MENEIEKIVPHDFKYHAEIKYETIDAFNFTMAVGNTLDELLQDIHIEMKNYQERFPELVLVLKDPNKRTYQDITKFFKKKFKLTK